MPYLMLVMFMGFQYLRVFFFFFFIKNERLNLYSGILFSISFSSFLFHFISFFHSLFLIFIDPQFPFLVLWAQREREREREREMRRGKTS